MSIRYGTALFISDAAASPYWIRTFASDKIYDLGWCYWSIFQYERVIMDILSTILLASLMISLLTHFTNIDTRPQLGFRFYHNALQPKKSPSY